MSFNSKSKAGYFLVIEGPEGAGKGTLISGLIEKLKSEGENVISTFEPGATSLGKRIRNLLLDSKNEHEISSTSELLLFFADRAQHLEQVIKPALEQGATIICDRFVYSTIAYQCYGRGISLETIDKLSEIVLADLVPDLVILLDIDPKIGLKRALKRGEPDRMEKENIVFHDRVRNGFLEIAKSNPYLFSTINAELSEKKVLKLALEAIQTSRAK